MSDTLNYSVPASGQPVSTDEITIDGVPQHLQRMKLGLGANNAYQGDLAFGAAVTASSIPVNIASDQYVKTILAKSTLIETVESASGLNALFIQVDTSDYRHVSIQLSNSFTATVSFEGSNDNVTWYPLLLANTIGGQATSSSTIGLYQGPINTKYFRLRLSAYTGGTVTATAEFSGMPNETVLPLSSSDSSSAPSGFYTTSTPTLPSGSPVEGSAALLYGYNTPTSLWQRIPAGTVSPSPTGVTAGLYTRSVGPSFNNLGKKATYYASSNNTAEISITPNAVTSLGYIWGSGNRNVSLQKVLVTYAGGDGGLFSLRLTKITAQHASGAGVNAEAVTPQDMYDPGATVSFYAAPTNAPTRHTTDLVTTVYGANTDGQVELMDILEGKGFVIPSGQPLGWEVRAIAGSGTRAITTSPAFASTFVWTEE